MGKIYLVRSCYIPNEAPTNRFLSFLEGFSKLGVDVEAVFVLSDKNNSRIANKWPHVSISYLWDHFNVKNRYLRQLSYDYLSRKFVRQLQKGDTVLLLEPQRMLFHLLKKDGISIYAEVTEHPYVISNRTLNTRRFIEDCKRINGLFVISTPLRDFFVKEGVKRERIHIVNMTVDASRFNNLTRKKTKDDYIAYCGTASNNKDGVDELIKAFAIVHQRIRDIKLYIIGKPLSDNDESGNMILVGQLGLSNNVVFTGVLPAGEMPQVLKNADVLVLARPDSLQAQCGFPTKLGEYLLTENPVVVTRVGDIPLFLEDGKTALLAEQRNAQDFADKVIWAIEHRDDALIIGKAGAQVALSSFNCVIESQKILDVIKGKENW